MRGYVQNHLEQLLCSNLDTFHKSKLKPGYSTESLEIKKGVNFFSPKTAQTRSVFIDWHVATLQGQYFREKI